MSSQPTVDPEVYIAALPVRPISAPRFRVPKHYQQSRWPLLKPYNGFTGVERRRGGQLASWLLASGCITMPVQCDICASLARVAFHGETYYHVGRWPALCGNCHRAVHLRPWRWDAWRKIVDANVVTGNEWFALAPRSGLDIAEHLRSLWGWRVADIERSAMTPLPDTVTVLLPHDMLPHPAF